MYVSIMFIYAFVVATHCCVEKESLLVHFLQWLHRARNIGLTTWRQWNYHCGSGGICAMDMLRQLGCDATVAFDVCVVFVVLGYFYKYSCYAYMIARSMLTESISHIGRREAIQTLNGSAWYLYRYIYIYIYT